MIDSEPVARGPAVRGGVGCGARALRRLSFALAVWSAFGCGGRGHDDAPPAEPRRSDDTSADGGVGGSAALSPPGVGMAGAPSTWPYCSPAGVPTVLSATYLTDARPVLPDAAAPLLDSGVDSGSSDAGLDAAAGSTNRSPQAPVQVEIRISFFWGTPFEIGPVIPLTEGVQVLTPAASARRFTLSIPAHAATARVEFRYVCGVIDQVPQVEIALHATSVEARVVGYSPPFE